MFGSRDIYWTLTTKYPRMRTKNLSRKGREGLFMRRNGLLMLRERGGIMIFLRTWSDFPFIYKGRKPHCHQHITPNSFYTTTDWSKHNGARFWIKRLFWLPFHTPTRWSSRVTYDLRRHGQPRQKIARRSLFSSTAIPPPPTTGATSFHTSVLKFDALPRTSLALASQESLTLHTVSSTTSSIWKLSYPRSSQLAK